MKGFIFIFCGTIILFGITVLFSRFVLVPLLHLIRLKTSVSLGSWLGPITALIVSGLFAIPLVYWLVPLLYRLVGL